MAAHGAVMGKVGSSLLNDISNTFWVILVIKALLVLIVFLSAPMAVGYMEHKILAHMQARLGPMYAGRFHGCAQLIAYELPLILAAAAVVMQAGTLSLIGIAQAQQHYWYVFPQIVGFGIFMVASLAELTRPPFDMPIADSEIIFGAYTEYTGLRFAFFLLAEYGGIVALSAIASVLFLGAYQPIPGLSFIPGWIWMSAKIGGLSFFIIWLRATYPRLREDQLQRFSWTVLIPIALVDIMATAFFKVAF